MAWKKVRAGHDLSELEKFSFSFSGLRERRVVVAELGWITDH